MKGNISAVLKACVMSVGLALLVASCTPVTPATRIAENPVMFKSLPPRQQVLVQQGRICEGMNRDAVFLAWGSPGTSPLVGSQDGKMYERWVYQTLRPVMVMQSGWSSPYWGYPGWCGPYPYPDTGYAYVPEQSATVTFENGKVVSWERRK